VDHEHYMRRAIEIARGNPDAPFGCVIANGESGEILAEGLNDAEKSPILHGETAAVMNLFDGRPNADPSNLVVYTTAEPCPMCSGAILWSGIPGSSPEPASKPSRDSAGRWWTSPAKRSPSGLPSTALRSRTAYSKRSAKPSLRRWPGARTTPDTAAGQEVPTPDDTAYRVRTLLALLYACISAPKPAERSISRAAGAAFASRVRTRAALSVLEWRT
jgi:cytidine/deoxycytidylate deaminase-like protein